MPVRLCRERDLQINMKLYIYVGISYAMFIYILLSLDGYNFEHIYVLNLHSYIHHVIKVKLNDQCSHCDKLNFRKSS